MHFTYQALILTIETSALLVSLTSCFTSVGQYYIRLIANKVTNIIWSPTIANILLFGKLFK